MAPSSLAAGLICFARISAALGPQLGLPQMWKQFHRESVLESVLDSAGSAALRLADSGAPHPWELYRAHNLSVPVDHFHNDSLYEPHSDAKFPLRYFYDDRFYKPGGPVIAYTSGESRGDYRTLFLQKGIIAILAEATNGLGVVIEHRYYGDSIPTPDFSTANLRFLTTAQALADAAYLAQNIVFPGKLANISLNAPETPWIVYGASYGGALSAFLRKLYPDVFWGAISSSGVTEAVTDFWEYFEAARLYAPAGCAEATQKLTHVVDNILLQKGNTTKDDIVRLKTAFGLENVTESAAFGDAILDGIESLQGRYWYPDVDDREFLLYCGNMTSDEVFWPETERLDTTVRELLSIGGYKAEVEKLATPFKNYIGYVNFTTVSQCPRDETQDECFGYGPDKAYQADDLKQTWRLWPFQRCSQWGYFVTGSGVPDTQLPLISRTIDLEYKSLLCRKAFNITTLPDVDAINKYGGYNISYPRLAIIGGEADPWRAATPNKIGLPRPKSTIEEPNLVIRGAVHAWDVYGLFENETTATLPPEPVKEAHAFEVEFVKAWLDEWKEAHG